MRKAIALAVVAGAASLFVSAVAQATTGNWIGPTSSNWSDTTKWQGGIVPNAQGDIAQYVANNGSQITLVDVSGGIRVGTLRVAATTNVSWQVRPNTDVIMDQDGYSGPGRASIINDIQSTTTTSNPAIFINSTTTGSLILNDDLFISNTSNSTRSGAIQMQSKIQGNGNIWIENISNNIGVGQITFTNAGNFGGNTTIAKGAVTISRHDVFSPTPANVVTIGSTGGGNATLAFVGSNTGNMENNIVAAANTGGTNVFATSAAATGLVNIKSSSSQTLPYSLVTLNGDLSFSTGGTGLFQIGDPIVGAGKLTKIGPGPMRVSNTNTYSGGTIVNVGSLAVGHADALNNGFGFYDATDGTLGSGNVTVNSSATFLEIESGVAGVNVIADTKTLSLVGGGTVGLADQGYALLDSGINETVGGLILGGVAQTTSGTYGSTSSLATYQSDEYFSGSGIITLTLPTGLPGDFNSDGKVDAGDYATWRKNEVANAALPNDNGAANQAARFTLWRANFGNPPGAGAGLHNAQVPEPGTLLLAVAGVLLPCIGRRRR